VRAKAPGLFVVTPESGGGAPGTPWTRLRTWLLGAPIPSEQEEAERLHTSTALGVLGGDLIASSVYGPEAMIGTLAMAGTGALLLDLPIAALITVLLAILVASYQQTVKAYPSGAGGYVVASANLGALFGLVAAAALLIDYSLDVAVSIATGTQSLTSAIPALADAKVPLSLAALAVIALANLRGMRTTGFAFALPVYLYIFSTLGTLAYGVFRWATSGLPDYVPPQAVQSGSMQPTQALGLFLILRAFSSGAVALTGVEAVSNGVRYLKPPEVRNARITLTLMALVFGALFVGISFLSGQLRVLPDTAQTETVVSQLARTFLGRGGMYYVVQFSALAMLILAANTGFADFPRVLSQLAEDRFLPQQFAVRGRRLSFSNGIVLVTVVAAVLLVGFKSSLDALIPLFTVGAFGTFTLSQAGMVRHWWRNHERHWRVSMVLNAIGALTTAVVLGVVIVSKFLYGAWAVVLLWPLLVLLLRALGRHYEQVDRETRISTQLLQQVRSASTSVPPWIVIPVDSVNSVVLNALAYARQLTAGDSTDPPIEAVHITDDPAAGMELQRRWQELGLGIRLTVVESPYRDRVGAFISYLDAVERRQAQAHRTVTVLLPETLPRKLWQLFLHNGMALHLKSLLLVRPRTAVISVPYSING
jgi:amino acid transporter